MFAKISFQWARVRNLDAAQHELAAGDQLMNVITDANVNHARSVNFFGGLKKKFRGARRRAGITF